MGLMRLLSVRNVDQLGQSLAESFLHPPTDRPTEIHRPPHPHHADGVPPGGVADQGTGIRRSGTVAPPDRVFNPPQRDASRADACTEIVMGLVPERAALDPLHHVVGHDHHASPT